MYRNTIRGHYHPQNGLEILDHKRSGRYPSWAGWGMEGHSSLRMFQVEIVPHCSAWMTSEAFLRERGSLGFPKPEQGGEDWGVPLRNLRANTGASLVFTLGMRHILGKFHSFPTCSGRVTDIGVCLWRIRMSTLQTVTIFSGRTQNHNILYKTVVKIKQYDVRKEPSMMPHM